MPARMKGGKRRMGAGRITRETAVSNTAYTLPNREITWMMRGRGIHLNLDEFSKYLLGRLHAGAKALSLVIEDLDARFELVSPHERHVEDVRDGDGAEGNNQLQARRQARGELAEV